MSSILPRRMVCAVTDMRTHSGVFRQLFHPKILPLIGGVHLLTPNMPQGSIELTSFMQHAQQSHAQLHGKSPFETNNYSASYTRRGDVPWAVKSLAHLIAGDPETDWTDILLFTHCAGVHHIVQDLRRKEHLFHAHTLTVIENPKVSLPLLLGEEIEDATITGII